MKKNLEEMQVKVANKRAILESHDGEEFSLITVAKNVLCEDGTTMQDYFDSHSEPNISTKIVNSNSMSKVGQGDNVDFSDNVMNGAYEDVVLKGKSLVNVIQEPSSQDVVLPYAFEDGQYVTINDTKESGALGVELKGQTLVNLVPKMNNSGNESSLVYITEDEIKISEDSTAHRQGYWTSNEVLSKFKTNTTYTVIANITENTLTSNFILINAYAAVGGDIASTMLRVPVNFTGRFVGVFETVSDFTGRTRLGFNADSGSEGKLTMKNDMVILEGDWTNQELPFDSFFTGMTSCKMPILHTVGKNLFDGNLERGSLDIDTGKPSADNSYNRTVNFIRIYPNKEYRLRANGTVNGRVFYYDENKVYISTQLNENRLTNIPSNAKYLKFRIGADILSNGQEIQLEEGSIATPYEPHKSSILSLPEEVVLRKVNGVEDTLNLNTGEYVQRTKEIVLNGSENWRLNKSLGDGSFYQFVVNIVQAKKVTQQLVVCDKLVSAPNESINNRIWIYEGTTMVIHSSCRNVDEMKTWLQQNPLTVQYELATPVVTKFNLPSTLKSWNTTTHIYSEIPENTLYPTLSHSNPTYPVIIKPSTKYSIVANSYSNSHTNSAINFNLGGATVSTTVGSRVTTITTPSALSNELLTMNGRGNKLNNVMVIEGDVVGDEPYFEGMCDSKSPILLNCGKNLAKLTRNYTSFGLTFKVIDDTLYVDGTAERILDYYLTTNNCENSKMLNSLEVGTMVTLSNSLGLRNFFGVWRNGTTDDSWFSNTMTIQNGDNNIRCFIRFDQGSTYNNQAIKIQLEATQNPTTYEPYKSNTTTFEQKDDKTIVLRSLPNGVCDTLNVNTGEYVRRVGEITLNGSENKWIAIFSYNGTEDYSTFKLDTRLVDGKKSTYPTNSYIADKLRKAIMLANTEEFVHINDQSMVCIKLSQTRLREQTVECFKEWLSQNPITVQYELATPIVKQVNVEGYPYAYENGHILLESGSQEQSLTPTIEYSIVANRGGQIRSNQRMVERHQKKLDSLYAMTLVNMIDSQYKQTLMELKSELKGV